MEIRTKCFSLQFHLQGFRLGSGFTYESFNKTLTLGSRYGVLRIAKIRV